MRDKPHILVVDDEELMRLGVKGVLETRSYWVTTAASAEEALRVLRMYPFDLVLTDVSMAGISGIGLLSQIKLADPNIPVVIMTGQPSVTAAVECMKLGAADYLTKPFPANQLTEVVAKVLAGRDAIDGAVDDTADVRTGTPISIAGYNILARLGEGNKGIVYLVERCIGQEMRKFAFKIIKLHEFAREDREKIIARFLREAEIASRIQHPNLVHVYEYAVNDPDKLPYIVMEYVDGNPLTNYIDNMKLATFLQRVAMMRQLAAGLAVLHEHDVCHRDIKPGNVMVQNDLTVKIMDFGIARQADSHLTLTTTLIGTPNYLSPEAFRSSRVDHRSDLYALGVLGYELFLGVRPFAADDLIALEKLVRTQSPPTPSSVDDGFPQGMEDILLKLLEKNPDHRYQSARQLIADIDAFTSASAANRSSTQD